jgi:hypothetical protein
MALLFALGAAFIVLEAWASGVRLTKIMIEWGERSAAADAARAQQRRAPVTGSDPTVIYVQPEASAPDSKPPHR